MPSAWRNEILTFEITAGNTTHYSFSVGLSSKKKTLQTLAYVPGEIISWGFTGALLGVYATANGGDGTAPAYVSDWNYVGRGQVRDNGAKP